MNRRPTKSRSGYDSFSARDASRFTAASPDTHFFETRKKKSLARRLLWLAALLLLALLLGNFAVNQFVFVRRVEVPVTGLPEAFDGYTLLHISDLKGALFGAGQSRLAFALRGADFDAVALTGDMVSARGNAEPLYALIEALRDMNPAAPIYFIAGDDDPEPASMDYATGGSPFAPWVLGARQRGATLLSAPQSVERGGQRLWLTTSSQLNLDIGTMQGQFELQYLAAQRGGDEDELELAKYNLQWLEQTRTARAQMKGSDAVITLTHTPPADQEVSSRIDLVLCGHYLGGLTRLPGLGPLFIPSLSLPRYGVFPGAQAYCGLQRAGRTWVYASTGLGSEDSHYPAFFFRFFNPPTVTLVTLTPSSL